MKFIAHRGNLKGKSPKKENHPDYITNAIKKGFDVEIDIWYINGVYLLGHDIPQYEIGFLWLIDNVENLWCHAKNLEALYNLINCKKINVFWHQEDDYTLTSHEYIWTYPNKPIVDNCNKQIVLLFNWVDDITLKSVGGICSDEIIQYKNKFI